MNILTLLRDLQDILHSSRQTGSTTFLTTIGNIGGSILCANQGQVEYLRRHQVGHYGPMPRTVSMLSKHDLFTLRVSRTPIVVDNYAVDELCRLSIAQMEQDAKEIQHLTTGWHRQNLEYEGKLQKAGADLYHLQAYVIPEYVQRNELLKRQLEAVQRKLVAKQVKTIRVKRGRKVK